jgi:hypothetical protein
VTNPTPVSLNIGQNAITITLKALDNSTNSITFNVLKAQPIKRSPAVVLPGLDPNYVSSSSSNVISSSIISSVTSSSSSINMTFSSDIGSISSSNSSLSSTNSSINSASSTIVDNNKAPNFTIENPFILLFLMLFPLVIITGIILLSKGNKRKIKKKKNLNK